MLVAQLNRIIEAATVAAAWDAHVAHMAHYGFDRLLYAYTRLGARGRLQEPGNALMLSNHRKEYLDQFVGKGYYRDAPMVRWTNDNAGVMSWRHIDRLLAEGRLSEAERRVVKFNRRHGLVAGLSISFNDVVPQARGGIGLVARAGMDHAAVEAVWQRHEDEILLLNRVTHLKIMSLPHPQARVMLTERQREALEWVAAGKTTQDIALLMGVAAVTVEKHLRLARAALEVESTAQAVAKATMMNQIFT